MSWWSDPGQRRAVLAEVAVAAVLLVAGVLIGVLWGWLAPSVARSADLGESRVASDGLLALLSLGAGLVTAIVLVALPGPRPVARLAVVLAAATAANLVAAAVGRATGVHLPWAPGVALLWPLLTAVLTAVRALAGLVVNPDGDGGYPPRRARRDLGHRPTRGLDGDQEISAPPVR